MSKVANRHRITLQLDPRIALEALILNQIERTPKARKQEWLRRLLVQGFRVECQMLMEASPTVSSGSRSGFSNWLATGSIQKSISRMPRSNENEMLKQSRTISASSGSDQEAVKPFVQLSRVIG